MFGRAVKDPGLTGEAESLGTQKKRIGHLTRDSLPRLPLLSSRVDFRLE
jgi:hypothetical protein